MNNLDDLIKSNFPADYSNLIYKIKGCAFSIRNELGRFLHERPYQMALEHALKKTGIEAYREVSIHVVYDGIDCGKGFSADILLPPNIVIELKATPEMYDIQYSQLSNYINLLHSPFGMLINFGIRDFKDGIHIIKGNPVHFPKYKAYPVLENKE